MDGVEKCLDATLRGCEEYESLNIVHHDLFNFRRLNSDVAHGHCGIGMVVSPAKDFNADTVMDALYLAERKSVV